LCRLFAIVCPPFPKHNGGPIQSRHSNEAARVAYRAETDALPVSIQREIDKRQIKAMALQSGRFISAESREEAVRLICEAGAIRDRAAAA